MWGKSSPAFTTWQENIGKRTGRCGTAEPKVSCCEPQSPQDKHCDLVPPIRIERTTRGLGISDRGVAQVLDDWAIPFSYRTNSVGGESVLFVACQSISS